MSATLQERWNQGFVELFWNDEPQCPRVDLAAWSNREYRADILYVVVAAAQCRDITVSFFEAAYLWGWYCEERLLVSWCKPSRTEALNAIDWVLYPENRDA